MTHWMYGQKVSDTSGVRQEASDTLGVRQGTSDTLGVWTESELYIGYMDRK